MNPLLHNQTAVITGGNTGIGKAIAIKYAENGAKVAILGTNPVRGKEAVDEINEITKNQSAVFYPVDVSKTPDVAAVFQKILQDFGHIDILVNNAGITRDQLLMKMSEEDWDLVLDVNAKSCYNTCQSIVRHMLKAKKGKIINVTSVIGLIGNVGQVNYAASKAAIIGFTKALAKELASRNICVNGIAPGYIETNMTQSLKEEQKNAILSKVPLGRLGTPNDVACLALFLASAQADYITGQIVTVDGGMVM